MGRFDYLLIRDSDSDSSEEPIINPVLPRAPVEDVNAVPASDALNATPSVKTQGNLPSASHESRHSSSKQTQDPTIKLQTPLTIADPVALQTAAEMDVVDVQYSDGARTPSRRTSMRGADDNALSPSVPAGGPAEEPRKTSPSSGPTLGMGALPDRFTSSSSNAARSELTVHSPLDAPDGIGGSSEHVVTIPSAPPYEMSGMDSSLAPTRSAAVVPFPPASDPIGEAADDARQSSRTGVGRGESSRSSRGPGGAPTSYDGDSQSNRQQLASFGSVPTPSQRNMNVEADPTAGEVAEAAESTASAKPKKTKALAGCGLFSFCRRKKKSAAAVAELQSSHHSQPVEGVAGAAEASVAKSDSVVVVEVEEVEQRSDSHHSSVPIPLLSEVEPTAIVDPVPLYAFSEQGSVRPPSNSAQSVGDRSRSTPSIPAETEGGVTAAAPLSTDPFATEEAHNRTMTAQGEDVVANGNAATASAAVVPASASKEKNVQTQRHGKRVKKVVRRRRRDAADADDAGEEEVQNKVAVVAGVPTSSKSSSGTSEVQRRVKSASTSVSQASLVERSRSPNSPVDEKGGSRRSSASSAARSKASASFSASSTTYSTTYDSSSVSRRTDSLRKSNRSYSRSHKSISRSSYQSSYDESTGEGQTRSSTASSSGTPASVEVRGEEPLPSMPLYQRRILLDLRARERRAAEELAKDWKELTFRPHIHANPMNEIVEGAIRDSQYRSRSPLGNAHLPSYSPASPFSEVSPQRIRGLSPRLLAARQLPPPDALPSFSPVISSYAKDNIRPRRSVFKRLYKPSRLPSPVEGPIYSHTPQISEAARQMPSRLRRLPERQGQYNGTTTQQVNRQRRGGSRERQMAGYDRSELGSPQRESVFDRLYRQRRTPGTSPVGSPSRSPMRRYSFQPQITERARRLSAYANPEPFGDRLYRNDRSPRRHHTPFYTGTQSDDADAAHSGLLESSTTTSFSSNSPSRYGEQLQSRHHRQQRSDLDRQFTAEQAMVEAA